MVRGLVENVRQHGTEIVQPLSEPAASSLGRFAAAVPVMGPSRVIHGVKLQFGNGHDAMPATAGYDWELEVAGGLPPRLHLTTAGLDLLAVSDRSTRPCRVRAPRHVFACCAARRRGPYVGERQPRSALVTPSKGRLCCASPLRGIKKHFE